MRITLLRPSLSNFITSEFHNREKLDMMETSLTHRVSLQCAITCVKTAFTAIDMLDEHKTSHPGEIGSTSEWWFNVLYLYTSATVLIAARLSSIISGNLSGNLSDKSIREHWDKAIGLLEAYIPFGESIAQLTTTLILLFRLCRSTIRASDSVPGRIPGSQRKIQTFPLSRTLRIWWIHFRRM